MRGSSDGFHNLYWLSIPYSSYCVWYGLCSREASVNPRKFTETIFKNFLFFLKHCYECKHAMLLWCDMSTFRKYIALIYPLSKTIKIFELKKSRFFHQSWKNRFLLKTKSPNKKRSKESGRIEDGTFTAQKRCLHCIVENIAI